MEWVKAARVYYGCPYTRTWVEQRCQSGDTRLWLPYIDDILDTSNDTSKWYYSSMRRQYESDLRDFDPGVTMITFNLYPDSHQPSGYLDFSRCADVQWTDVRCSDVRCTDSINMYFSLNNVVY